MQPERSTEKGAFVMIHIPHELRDEFPKEAHFIERLIKTDYEFGRLAASYDERDSALSLVRAPLRPSIKAGLSSRSLRIFKRRKHSSDTFRARAKLFQDFF
jgi:hypothetical protein